MLFIFSNKIQHSVGQDTPKYGRIWGRVHGVGAESWLSIMGRAPVLKLDPEDLARTDIPELRAAQRPCGWRNCEV